jgi:hypothetical protein
MWLGRPIKSARWQWYNSGEEDIMSVTHTQVTIISDHARPIKSLIEAAIQREIDLLRAGIRRTEQRVFGFEQQHQLSSAEFLIRHQHDEFAETLDTIDWIGELGLLERLREKERTLAELRVAD